MLFVNCLSMFKVCPEFVQCPIIVHTLSTNKNVVFRGLTNCWTGYGQTLDANIQFLSKYLRNKLFWTGYGQTLDAYVQCLSKLSLVGHRFDVLYIFDKNYWTCC